MGQRSKEHWTYHEHGTGHKESIFGSHQWLGAAYLVNYGTLLQNTVVFL